MDFVPLQKTNDTALFESFLNIYFSIIDSLPCSGAVAENKANHPGALSIQWCDGKLPIGLNKTEKDIEEIAGRHTFHVTLTYF